MDIDTILPDKLYNTRRFQKSMDLVRVALLLVAMLSIAYLAYNVEYVKTAANPCHVCIEKTGASCTITTLPSGERMDMPGMIDIGGLNQSG